MHDACPAHRLLWPHELLVGVGADGRFALVPGPPSALSASSLAPRAPSRAPAPSTTVSPAQAELQRPLARALERGAVIALDYGEAGRAATNGRPPAAHLPRRHGRRRPAGRPGTQDITVDVDFGAVRGAASGPGLQTTLDASQPDWLLAHGAAAAIAALPRMTPSGCGSRRSATRSGSGGAFRVLVQERD